MNKLEYIDINKFYHPRLENKHLYLYNYFVAINRGEHARLCGYIKPTNKTISSKCDIPERTLNRYIDTLEKNNFIRRETHGRKRKIYVLAPEWHSSGTHNNINPTVNNLNINNNIINTQNACVCEHIYKNNPVNTEYNTAKRNEFINTNNSSSACQFILTEEEIENLRKRAKQGEELMDEINKRAPIDFWDRPMAFIKSVLSKFKTYTDNGAINKKEEIKMNLTNYEEKLQEIKTLYLGHHGSHKKVHCALTAGMFSGAINDTNWDEIIDKIKKFKKYWELEGMICVCPQDNIVKMNRYVPLLETFLVEKRWENVVPLFVPKKTDTQKNKGTEPPSYDMIQKMNEKKFIGIEMKTEEEIEKNRRNIARINAQRINERKKKE